MYCGSPCARLLLHPDSLLALVAAFCLFLFSPSLRALAPPTPIVLLVAHLSIASSFLTVS
jgi:hypothetical protein